MAGSSDRAPRSSISKPRALSAFSGLPTYIQNDVTAAAAARGHVRCGARSSTISSISLVGALHREPRYPQPPHLRRPPLRCRTSAPASSPSASRDLEEAPPRGPRSTPPRSGSASDTWPDYGGALPIAGSRRAPRASPIPSCRLPASSISPPPIVDGRFPTKRPRPSRRGSRLPPSPSARPAPKSRPSSPARLAPSPNPSAPPVYRFIPASWSSTSVWPPPDWPE